MAAADLSNSEDNPAISGRSDVRAPAIAMRFCLRPDDSKIAAPNRSPASNRIAYADALRLTAIGAVVVSHIVQYARLTFGGRVHEFPSIGIWGVDCFFVLTGFLLSGRFFEAILGSKPFPSLADYFARRFLRIYPLYALALVVTITISFVVGPKPSVGDILAHITLTQGIFWKYLISISPPLWTMSIDAQFYIVLAVAALFLFRISQHVPVARRERLLWTALVLFMVVSIAERVISQLLIHAHEAYFFPATRNIVGLGVDFTVGALLALLELRHQTRARTRPWCLGSVAIGFALIAILVALPLTSQSNAKEVAAKTLSDIIGGSSVGFLLFGVLRGRFTALDAIVRSSFVVRGAELAYAIYLFHLPIILTAIAIYGRPIAKPLSVLGFGIVVALPILVVAFAVHRLVEKPFLRLRDRRREVVPTLP